MKKKIKKISAFIAVFTLTLSVFAASTAKPIQTTVESVDQHGNVNLTIDGKSFSSRGYSITDIVSVKVGNYKTFNAPIVKDYSDVNNGEFLLRLKDDEASLAINMGNFAKTTGAVSGTKVTISVKEHYGYLRTYHVRLLKKSDDRTQFASDEVFANFRCLKGGSIGKNKIFRSTNPIQDDARAPYAAKLVEQSGINVIINLADTKETAESRIHASPYYEELAKNGKVLFLNMGISFTDDEFISKFKETLLFIADNPNCVYYLHGKEGKNRTGYIAAVLEALCGASLDEIIADYMLSFENYYGVRKGSRRYDEIAKSIPYMFAHMNDGKAPTDKNIQKVTEKYIQSQVGLTQNQINELKKNLQ